MNYIDEYDVPTHDSAPLALAPDKYGRIWFTESNASKVGVFTPENATFKEYPVPGVGDMWGIAVDRNGAVWVTQYTGKGTMNPGGSITSGGHGSLLRLDPANGNVTVVDMPSEGTFPFRLISDEQGRVWFTELLGNKIGVYDPNAERLEEYGVPSSFAGPADLTFDTRGNLWFTEAYNESVAEFKPQSKTFVEYHLSTTDPSRFVASPVGIAVAPSGDVWFADHGGSWIVEFNPSSQALARYPAGVPLTSGYAAAVPNGLLMDGEGRVWFTEHYGNAIGFFDPSSSTLAEFPIPTGPISTALWIAQAPNRDVWFTEWSANKIGVLHTSLPLPLSSSLSQSHLRLAAGQQTSMTLSISPHTDISDNVSMKYSWSSYNPQDIQVTFSPDHPSLLRAANVQVQAELAVSAKAKPGNYTLSIGVDLDNVRVWATVPTQITPTEPAGGPPMGDVVLLLIAVVLLAGTAGLVLLARRARGRFTER